MGGGEGDLLMPKAQICNVSTSMCLVLGVCRDFLAILDITVLVVLFLFILRANIWWGQEQKYDTVLCK